MVTLNLEPVNPLDIVNNVAAEMQSKAAEQQQDLEVLIDSPLPFVRADPVRVIQVMTNLVDNALKYTPPGGQVTVDAEVADGFLVFSVQDNGIGISESDQERLFSRFFRSERALQTGAGGAGLGLYITRSLIELHGGEIWVESREDEGSTFAFSLPLVTQEGQAEADHEFRTISYRSEDRHILLIEDESGLANQIVHYLRNLGGYRVHVSKRGRDALDYVNSNRRRIDLIALDLHLPDMDGQDLIKTLRSKSATSDVPVIAIARDPRNSAAERRQVLDLGVARYLNRPVEIADLVSDIEQILPDQSEPSGEEIG